MMYCVVTLMGKPGSAGIHFKSFNYGSWANQFLPPYTMLVVTYEMLAMERIMLAIVLFFSQKSTFYLIVLQKK